MQNILAIAAHPDDIEIGCWGTLARYKKDGAKIHHLILSYGEDGGDKNERKREQLEVSKKLEAKVIFGNLHSAFLNNNSGRESIKLIEGALKQVKPEIIFTHSLNDRHQDHRLVNQATNSACRNFRGELYYYEGYSSLRYFQPLMFIDIGEFFPQKIEVLRGFKTQAHRFYLNPLLIESIAVFRAAQGGYLGKAEAFEVGGVNR